MMYGRHFHAPFLLLKLNSIFNLLQKKTALYPLRCHPPQSLNNQSPVDYLTANPHPQRIQLISGSKKGVLTVGLKRKALF